MFKNHLQNEYLHPPSKILTILALVGLGFFLATPKTQAYEAHVVNVTAKICNYAQTRTMGYWKNHEEVYIPYLPVNLGDENIDSVEKATEIFDNARAKEMEDMLKAQLLAMKFNIAHFGIGGYEVEGEGKTLDEIVEEADALLINGASREEMEAMKNLLDRINNMHQLRYCGTNSFDPEPENENDLVLDAESNPEISMQVLGLNTLTCDVEDPESPNSCPDPNFVQGQESGEAENGENSEDPPPPEGQNSTEQIQCPLLPEGSEEGLNACPIDNPEEMPDSNAPSEGTEGSEVPENPENSTEENPTEESQQDSDAINTGEEEAVLKEEEEDQNPPDGELTPGDSGTDTPPEPPEGPEVTDQI